MTLSDSACGMELSDSTCLGVQDGTDLKAQTESDKCTTARSKSSSISNIGSSAWTALVEAPRIPLVNALGLVAILAVLCGALDTGRRR